MKKIKTPCYIIDIAALEKNLKILKDVALKTGCKILLAQKCFSIYQTYPLISKYLDGTCSSGLNELKLAHEYFKKEKHIFAAAYRDDEISQIINIADTIIFNSIYQLEKYGNIVKSENKKAGIRINPECSTQKGDGIYDPCAEKSRLGIRLKDMPDNLPDYVECLHFHTLCEQNSDALKTTLDAFEQRFKKYLLSGKIKEVNFGGGHHVTKTGYDIELLTQCIERIKAYGIQVYIEPGEAVALNAGYYCTTVADIVDNNGKIAIVDGSAACHMPDVLEMPYRPPLKNSFEPHQKSFDYRIAGCTCLAGDVIGDYSFENPLKRGDMLYFEDAAIYTMVKNNTFNGINLPDIYLKTADGELESIKQFGYEDFKSRL